ncbi:MAG: DNA double-strand break repair nuclease NurA [Candidatus Chromulinivorax sp.]
MLNRSKVMHDLHKVAPDLFIGFAHELDLALQAWNQIITDMQLKDKIRKNKQELLIPWWEDSIGLAIDISLKNNKYTVLAVDGSQIYYDKHQGPPCFLINIGYMQLRYGLQGKAVEYGSYPYLQTKFDELSDFGSCEFINLEREALEFKHAFDLMKAMSDDIPGEQALCLFDGSLIFFHLGSQQSDLKEKFLATYCTILDQFYKHKMLIAGYMSLPKTKELVNLCKLKLVQFDNQLLEKNLILERLTDADIAGLYLKPYQRSIVFKSKAPISYLYPEHLQPYFCYFHVHTEIVRIEFPAWIGRLDNFVDTICAIVADQVIKGKGYPVCLFEAHEQAVVKSSDRDFFYQILEKISRQYTKSYVVSQKTIKKLQPIV